MLAPEGSETVLTQLKAVDEAQSIKQPAVDH
jgi:hypothetical protein